MVEAITQTASMPVARRVATPLFYYFGVFDDLFFYQFHDRTYGPTMTDLFDQINQIEYQKWSIINASSILHTLGSSFEQYSAVADYQKDYLKYNFTTPDHA